jgi:hypothetical protein
MAQTFHQTLEPIDKKTNLNDSLFENSKYHEGRNQTAFTTRTHSVSKNTQQDRNVAFGWRNSITPSNEDQSKYTASFNKKQTPFSFASRRLTSPNP